MENNTKKIWYSPKKSNITEIEKGTLVYNDRVIELGEPSKRMLKILEILQKDEICIEINQPN